GGRRRPSERPTVAVAPSPSSPSRGGEVQGEHDAENAVRARPPPLARRLRAPPTRHGGKADPRGAPARSRDRSLGRSPSNLHPPSGGDRAEAIRAHTGLPRIRGGDRDRLGRVGSRAGGSGPFGGGTLLAPPRHLDRDLERRGRGGRPQGDFGFTRGL